MGRAHTVTGPDAPIFVIGFQRSGTTLLQALLGAHPRIAGPPETYFQYRVADHADYFGDLSDDASLERALHDALNPPLDMFADCGFDEQRVLARARQGPRTYAGLFDAIMSDFAERAGKQRWSEKSAGQPIDAAWQLFPDAQVVHIVRDPRDVVASSLRMPWTDTGATQIARGWRSFTSHAIRRGFEAGPSRFLQIRYEDLARDPEPVLRILCTFLGEDYAPAMLDDPSLRRGAVPAVARGWQGGALAAIAPPREGAWREQLGRLDQARVHGVLGSMIGALGYQQRGVPASALALPFVARELVERAAARVRRPDQPLSPEERYLRARAFMASRVEMLPPEARPAAPGDVAAAAQSARSSQR